jgi:hypothetical protein
MTRGNVRNKAKPGTERHRDEARSGGGPRMHGMRWHDHAEPHALDRVSNKPAGGDGVEAADERTGMGKHIGRKDKGSTRVNSASPRGKGKPGIKSQ